MMAHLIEDKAPEGRMDGLEKFLEFFIGPRQPEFGCEASELKLVRMPSVLERFFLFAGRWPGHNPKTPYSNRFCMQDTLCSIRTNDTAPTLEVMDQLLIFVFENQGVWVAATEQSGIDPPVWISEDCSHRNPTRRWNRLDNPLSHFLVSFVMQEVLFGSRILSLAVGALPTFSKAGLTIEPIWLNGEYTWGIVRPSYFLVADCILVRHASQASDGEDWYGCTSVEGQNILMSLELPIET
jgi:hypothetical protein